MLKVLIIEKSLMDKKILFVKFVFDRVKAFGISGIICWKKPDVSSVKKPPVTNLSLLKKKARFSTGSDAQSYAQDVYKKVEKQSEKNFKFFFNWQSISTYQPSLINQCKDIWKNMTVYPKLSTQEGLQMTLSTELSTNGGKLGGLSTDWCL